MATISLHLDDAVNAALDSLCIRQGRDKGAVLSELVGRYVESERLRRALQDPELIRLYQELAAEDAALAEAGMGDYARQLDEADQP